MPWDPFELLAYAGASAITVIAVGQVAAAIVTYYSRRPLVGFDTRTAIVSQIIVGTGWSDFAAEGLLVVLALAWACTRRWLREHPDSLGEGGNETWDAALASSQDREPDQDREPGHVPGTWQDNAPDDEAARHWGRLHVLALWTGVLLLLTFAAGMAHVATLFVAVGHPRPGFAATVLDQTSTLLVALIVSLVGLGIVRRISGICRLGRPAVG